MATVAETELEQRVSEFVNFVREFAANKGSDFKIVNKCDNAVLVCIEREVTLDFSV